LIQRSPHHHFLTEGKKSSPQPIERVKRLPEKSILPVTLNEAKDNELEYSTSSTNGGGKHTLLQLHPKNFKSLLGGSLKGVF